MESVYNWIGNRNHAAESGDFFEKRNPHNNELLWKVYSADVNLVDDAVRSSLEAFYDWSRLTPIERGCYISEMIKVLFAKSEDIISCNSLETGKSRKNSFGEFKAAIQQAKFWEGEGMRLYGQSYTSENSLKFSTSIRVPIGVAALIVPANTALANIAWKLFPALVCGNTVVLKASENAPKLASFFGEIAKEINLPSGVLNILQGEGKTGELLVKHKDTRLISFTGSTEVGKRIAYEASNSLKRVSLELGGKNPFIVCEDANLKDAVDWATLSAFSNAGQRCSAASRIIIADKVYDEFKREFSNRIKSLKLGIDDDCDLGPVITKRHQKNIEHIINQFKNSGANVLSVCEAVIPNIDGNYILPTVIEENGYSDFSDTEFFAPVVVLSRYRTFEEAIALANKSLYGLTAAIHTNDINKAMHFAKEINAGVANVNFGTYGSEPHMPFGGLGISGNGSREPGTEAINVYTELKNISILMSK